MRAILITPNDPPPFEVYRPDGKARVLVTCDHASRAFPARLGRLGLGEASTWRHIAWDIGAGDLARALSERLDAAAVLAGYSRLVIDCNRRLSDPACVVTVADGDRIIGNEGLTDTDRSERVTALYEPYHSAIAGRLRAFRDRGIVPVLIAVHSFTPVFGGQSRPWHVGVLWDKDERIAVPLLARLRAEPDLVVGDNEPYSRRHSIDHTVERHAERSGLPNVCLEIRQDELTGAADAARWADILSRALRDILADDALYALRKRT